MRCKYCKRKAIIKTIDGYLCEYHFNRYIENKVKKTIEKYKLFNKNDKILLAISGGKDSMSLAYILNKLDYNFDCLYIDLNIKNFSNICKEVVINFCNKIKKNVYVIDIRKEYNIELKKINNRPICSICGIIKRYIMNKFAYENNYDVLLTGHNLDDVFSFIMMNIISGNISYLKKIYPYIPRETKLVKKVKPLFFIYEKEIKLYAIINKILFCDQVCPYSIYNTQNKIKETFKSLEKEIQFFRYHFVKNFLKIIKEIKYKEERLYECKYCGFPTTNKDKICSFCKIKEKLKINDN